MGDVKTPGSTPALTAVMFSRYEMAHALKLTGKATPTRLNIRLYQIFLAMDKLCEAAGESEVRLEWSIPEKTAPESNETPT